MQMELIEAWYFGEGHNKSPEAERAEAEGKLPLTRAVPVLAKQLGVTQKTAREILLGWGPCEAHRTGKYARLTDYYDVPVIGQIWKGWDR